jgi:hypothetical protein
MAKKIDTIEMTRKIRDEHAKQLGKNPMRNGLLSIMTGRRRWRRNSRFYFQNLRGQVVEKVTISKIAISGWTIRT